MDSAGPARHPEKMAKSMGCPHHSSLAPHHFPIAVIAVTRNGVDLALQIQANLPGSTCYVPDRHRFAVALGAVGFDRLRTVVPALWQQFRGLVFIMATGIVVRQIASLLRDKTQDPAVVVLDERGQYVISLVSGHLGGANRLAQTIARIISGQPVITTASEVQNRPAIDLIAQELGLTIENPAMIAAVARRLLEDEPLWVVDPEGRLDPWLGELPQITWLPDEPLAVQEGSARVGIWVSPCLAPADCSCLILRPRCLVVGVGCNRGTAAEEILEFLARTFEHKRLSLGAIRNLASIDLKADEEGILEAGRRLGCPVHFFSRQQLESVAVPNPSRVVQVHTGVESVCEATALVSAQSRELIVTKVKTANVTLAAARVASPL